MCVCGVCMCVHWNCGCTIFRNVVCLLVFTIGHIVIPRECSGQSRWWLCFLKCVELLLLVHFFVWSGRHGAGYLLLLSHDLVQCMYCIYKLFLGHVFVHCIVLDLARDNVLLGDSGRVVNSLDFCPASLKSLGCFYFWCILSSQWKAVTVNLLILHCQL